MKASGTRLALSLAILVTGFSPGFAQMTALLPEIRQNGAVKQLFVDGKPFLMLSGELHNSTASSVEYLKPVLNNPAALHRNTVIGAVSREFTEPEEGRFDFSGPPRPSPNGTRPFAIVVNTAPGEYLPIGAHGAPKFAADSPTSKASRSGSAASMAAKSQAVCAIRESARCRRAFFASTD
jgi:beta-galactosidase GanA